MESNIHPLQELILIVFALNLLNFVYNIAVKTIDSKLDEHALLRLL